MPAAIVSLPPVSIYSSGLHCGCLLLPTLSLPIETMNGTRIDRIDAGFRNPSAVYLAAFG
jgi:hypothetical protein